jgi:hypothetical protein
LYSLSAAKFKKSGPQMLALCNGKLGEEKVAQTWSDYDSDIGLLPLRVCVCGLKSHSHWTPSLRLCGTGGWGVYIFKIYCVLVFFGGPARALFVRHADGGV